jgi:hypothetical protein
MSQRDEYAKDRLNRLKNAVSALRKVLVQRGVNVVDVSAADEAKMLSLAAPVITKWAANLPAANRPIYEKAKTIIAEHKGAKK